MNLFVIIPSIIFTIFSTAIIVYVSMATMVGPWIAPAIVLMSSAILKMRRIPKNQSEMNKEVALIQTVGSVGGIVAMGLGFSLPTLYFLDPVVFNQWLQSPLYFCSLIAAVCLSAGGFGIWLARCFAEKFIKKEKLAFPVSQLIYKMITSQTQEKQTKGMFLGFAGSWVLCFLRDGLLKFQGFLPKIYYLFSSFAGKEIAIAVSPMFWAIGFITGAKIVFPLFIGLISKYLLVFPLNNHSAYLPFKLFDTLSPSAFIVAFCAGLVVCELILGLLKYPGVIVAKFKQFSGYNFWSKTKSFFVAKKYDSQIVDDSVQAKSKYSKLFLNVELAVALIASSAFLYYLNFSFISQIVLLVFTAMATYQISFLGGKVGLITFGRFATFIMIPMMLIFKLDFIQITFLCVFFNVCAAAASDLLFDYKVGQLCKVDFKQIHRYQWLGLVVTSLCVGLFLWLLFTTLQVGSADLFAQRAKARALLIQSLDFNLYVVLLGFLYGVVLKKLKISPTMVFGGILMPNSITIGLVIGALISKFSKKGQDQQPLWSGVFAGESIWILFSITLKMLF